MFADFITGRAKRLKTALCVGFDPVIEKLPNFFQRAGDSAQTNEDALFEILRTHGSYALRTVEPYACVIKPNIAFYEQYGLGGMRALSFLLSQAKDQKIPAILDCKRGDIGSTALAYARAYLSPASFAGSLIADFEADAVTINPYMGFETVEVFVKASEEGKKGLFILVKTSNPGNGDLQNSEKIASWITANGASLMGSSGVSGLGAVVGATHPREIVNLRLLMPHALFLIPGVGAQGASASDVAAAFTSDFTGAIINVSRGILSAHKNLSADKATLLEEIRAAAERFRDEIASAQPEGGKDGER